MNFSSLTICCLLIFLQFSFSLSTLSKVWEKFMGFSCEFSSEAEKFIPREGSGGRRSRRSILDDDPNFDNPEELFAYLYPLANLKPEDLEVEAQRSSSTYQSNSIYAWTMDLGTLWLTECKSRAGEETGGKETNDDMVEEDEVDEDPDWLPVDNNARPFPERQTRSVYAQDETFGESNYRPRNGSYSHRILSSRTYEGSSSSHAVYNNLPPSEHQINTQNASRTRSKNRRKRPMVDGLEERKLLTINLSPSNVTTTTTAAPETTTTASPATSDDNFFSSYGGDIEYFFPLISFGIPFDGEITFLGFHGFKGLFPYK